MSVPGNNRKWRTRKVSEMNNPNIPNWDNKSIVTTNQPANPSPFVGNRKHPFIGKKVISFQVIDLETTRFDVNEQPTVLDVYGQWMLLQWPNNGEKIWHNSNEIMQIELSNG